MKLLQLILLSIFLNHCFLSPTTQREDCYVKKGKLYGDRACGPALIFLTYGYFRDPTNKGFETMYLYGINECLKALEYEEKCQEASPYIPVWPAEQ